MFTGIVQAKGTVVSIEKQQDMAKLVVSIPVAYLEHLNIGASIAINGVCLTVTQFEAASKDVVGQVVFDVIDETLRLTNLSELKQRNLVNFERSLTFGTEIGGHIVSGHIQTCAKISKINKTMDNCNIRLVVDPQWMKFILYKGFITIDGISLTVGEVFEDGFMLHLIPETLAITNLGQRKVNDILNIEVDQQTYSIVKTVERVLAQKTSKFT
ncbi:MAG: riboflavin synthase subunit alpha [Algicola sp.]|nr:riboflavin synthase subunit alpha [Algicola sp.]